jgi:hypothetical protein
VETVLLQVSQLAACNSKHSFKSRLARWLMTSHERLGSSQLDLSQQNIARIFGVRRATVATALSDLELAGAVEKSRRAVRVKSRSTLESLACGCYRAVRQSYQWLLPGGLLEPSGLNEQGQQSSEPFEHVTRAPCLERCP